MGYIVLIAVILAILFGASVGLSFFAVIWLGTIVLLAVSAVYMTVYQLTKRKVGSALWWAAAAVFFGWLLSVCF